jgi:hypothetical protein
MLTIKQIGNCSECPYCGRMFRNGISIAVRSCTCEGMRNAVQMEKLVEKVANLEKQIYGG